MTESNREIVARRAAEIRAEQAGEQLAGVAAEIREELARHSATLASIFMTMEAVVAASGIELDKPAAPRLRLIKGGLETG